MTFADALEIICEALADWARPHGGTAEIAGDAVGLFSMLGRPAGAVRACLWPISEEPQGNPAGGQVVRKFWVVLSRGRGFSLERSDNLVRTGPTETPLFDLLESATRTVRGLSFDGNVIEYLGWQPYQLPTDRYVDAYQLQFALAAQLSEPTLTEH